MAAPKTVEPKAPNTRAPIGKGKEAASRGIMYCQAWLDVTQSRSETP